MVTRLARKTPPGAKPNRGAPESGPLDAPGSVARPLQQWRGQRNDHRPRVQIRGYRTRLIDPLPPLFNGSEIQRFQGLREDQNPRILTFLQKPLNPRPFDLSPYATNTSPIRLAQGMVFTSDSWPMGTSFQPTFAAIAKTSKPQASIAGRARKG